MKNGEIKHLFKEHAYQNIPLNYNQAYKLGVHALEGCNGNPLAQIQSIAALSALHTKATYQWRRETDGTNVLPASAAEQIAGICAAIFDCDIAKSEFGFCKPGVLSVMDNCGMGGDLTVTANVSTLAAFIASAAGIRMCKHGSPANADGGRHGSSDFISDLGIPTFCDKQILEQCVETEGFGYTEALDTRYKNIHSQTHKVAMIPHMNDIIGPITNPVDPKLLTRRVLGVNHLVAPQVVAEAYVILNDHNVTNLKHGLFVRGYLAKSSGIGVDELSICEGGTDVAELRDGQVSEYRLEAADFGLKTVSPLAISPPPGTSKGGFSMAILRGEVTGPPLDMVLANAALLFFLDGRSSDLKECFIMAKEVHESGRALKKVAAVREFLSHRIKGDL